MRSSVRNICFPVLCLLLVCGETVTAEDKPNDTIHEKLQGRWKVVSGVNQGRELTRAEVNGTSVTITANSIVTYDRDQQQRFAAVFRIDSEKMPQQITMTTVSVDASVAGKSPVTEQESKPVALGILKFDDAAKWVLCYALPGSDRPQKFESADGSKVMLFTLEKMQDDIAAQPESFKSD